MALDALDQRSVVYNLGNGQGYSVWEIVAACQRVTGHPLPVVETERRPGDPPRLVASAARVTADLGWRPRYTDLDELVATAWRWHTAHPDGYGA
jgi:UDP-glucose 4-epimerase